MERQGICAPPLRVAKADRLEIHGRSDPELFFEIAAAPQLASPARHLAGKEHLAVALDIVALRAELSSARREAPDVPDDPGDAAAAQLPADRRLEVVRAHSRYVDRLANIALARDWSRQEQRDGFDIQMRRWGPEHGSRRLQIGIADKYRMVLVYLDERIPAEVSRFYAHLPKKNGKHSLQARTGPSEEALLLRRTPFRPGWNRHARDGGPYRSGPHISCPGASLDPKDCGLDDLPRPPDGERVADTRAVDALGVSDDDVPFERWPARLAIVGGASNYRERAALTIASGGRCESQLAMDFHADYRQPWRGGGPTDVGNGQARVRAATETSP